MLDYILSNATVYDGTGGEPYYADIGIQGATIKAIGQLKTNTTQAKKVIEMNGEAVAPGFIDIHSHSDLTLLQDGRGISKLSQGVTTEVTGNCSMSPAPVKNGIKDQIKQTFLYQTDVEWNWETMGDFLSKFKGELAINLCQLVGHGTIRSCVAGLKEENLTTKQLKQASSCLDQALDAGGVGLSTGLSYIPSSYADKHELTQLCTILEKEDGLYTSHLRDQGNNLIRSVKEAIDVARKSGVRLQISHLKAAGRPNWGKVKRAVELIDKARADGIEVNFDVYPYKATSQSMFTLVPDEFREGGKAQFVKNLRDTTFQNEIKNSLKDSYIRPEDIKIAAVKTGKNQQLTGSTLKAVAGKKGKGPWQCFVDLLVEEQGEVHSIVFLMSQDDMEFLLSVPYSMVASDGRAINPKGVWQNRSPPTLAIMERSRGCLAPIVEEGCLLYRKLSRN